MSKEFIPYEEALALKELGFDEIQHAQLAVDGCIGAKDLLTGTIGIAYENSATVDIAVKDGKVLSVTYNGVDDEVL